MSYIAEWVGFRAASPSSAADAEAMLQGEGFEASRAEDGWFWFHHPERGHFEFGVDRFVEELARVADGPASGGWVFESSLAVIAGAEADGPGFHVVINDVDGFVDEDEDAARWSETTASREAIQSSAADLARWSRNAPRTVEAGTVLAWTPTIAALEPLEGDRYRPPYTEEHSTLFFHGPNPWGTYDNEASWVFAEDGVRFVFHLLGFPPFDAIASPRDEAEAQAEETPVEPWWSDPPAPVSGWDVWSSSESGQYWLDRIEEVGWERWARGWNPSLDVFRGNREFALVPESRPRGAGPPGLWIALVAQGEEVIGRHLQTAIPGGSIVVVYPIAPESCWLRESANMEQAKNDLVGATFGREPGEWRPVPDDVERTWQGTFGWLLASVRA
jgi:hypothetical protein